MAISIGIIGSGDVGKQLAAGLHKHGYSVTIGTRDPAKLADFGASTGVAVATFAGACAGADAVILAVGGAVAEGLVRDLAGDLAGKIVLDATNPIAGPPVGGILPLFTGPNESLMERLAAAAPQARFVKAFSCVGNHFMIDPAFAGGKPTMFICGDDADAKAFTQDLLAEVGWDAEDVGGNAGARAIEPLVMLWCARGFLHGKWAHAFSLLRA